MIASARWRRECVPRGGHRGGSRPGGAGSADESSDVQRWAPTRRWHRRRGNGRHPCAPAPYREPRRPEEGYEGRGGRCVAPAPVAAGPRARRCARRGIATAVRKPITSVFLPAIRKLPRAHDLRRVEARDAELVTNPQARTHARERSTQEQDGSPHHARPSVSRAHRRLRRCVPETSHPPSARIGADRNISRALSAFRAARSAFPFRADLAARTPAADLTPAPEPPPRGRDGTASKDPRVSSPGVAEPRAVARDSRIQHARAIASRVIRATADDRI